MRPIVSFVNSPTYAISGSLARTLSPVVGNTDNTIKNSGEFADFIRDKTLNACEELVSFDVVSLFTKIPVDLAVKVAEERLREDASLGQRTGGYHSSAVFLPQNHAICIQRHLLSTDFWHSYGFARLCCLCQHGNGRRVTRGLSHFTLATSPVKPSNDCDNQYIGQTKRQCGTRSIKKRFSFPKRKFSFIGKHMPNQLYHWVG